MKFILVTMLGISFSTQLLAWGDLGHSAVGYIAEQNLSAEGKKFVHSIMGPESLGLAAIWPDHVRDDSRYQSFSPYHFFEIPEGMTYETTPRENMAKRSADVILDQAPELILLNRSSKKLNLLQKQIMLRYFVHVMGDVHQPLHIGNGVDMGGNLCDVKFPNADSGKSNKMNLHSVWDDGIVAYIKKNVIERANQEQKPIKYFSYRHLADAIMKEAHENGSLEEMKALIERTSKSDWYAESRSLHAEIYPGEVMPAKERPYCKFFNGVTGKVENGAYDANKIPEITSDYIEKSIITIKRRMILAGLRLAKEINRMSELRGDRAWTPEMEQEFFKKIMPEKKEEEGNPSKLSARKTNLHDWCHGHH